MEQPNRIRTSGFKSFYLPFENFSWYAFYWFETFNETILYYTFYGWLQFFLDIHIIHHRLTAFTISNSQMTFIFCFLTPFFVFSPFTIYRVPHTQNLFQCNQVAAHDIEAVKYFECVRV